MQKPIRTLVSATVIALMANQAAYAGAFSLYTESSAAAIGNFAAGIAAEGADASIGWYNPAGLVLIKDEQMVFSGVGVFPSDKITGTSTFDAEGLAYVQSFNGLDGAEHAFVPAVHYALPLGERAAFGFTLNAPFGLSTNWTNTSPVRYAGTHTELLTVNVSPELAGRLTDNFSIGAGLDLQWATVKFNTVLGAPFFTTPTAFDSISYNTGNSFAVGFHAGVLSTFNENHTRLGLNYQSSMDHTFYGYSRLTGPLADPAVTDPSAVFRSSDLYSNDIQLPNVVTLSGYQDVNNKLALLGSVVFTGWSVFQSIGLNNVAAFSLIDNQVLVNTVVPQNYRDVWRFAVGANYHVNDQWMMRVGGGYDQTPTVNAYRDIRLPDTNRWALSIGSHYQWRPNIGFDIGYTYLFGVSDSPINNTLVLDPATSTSNTVNALAKAHAQLVGLQVVWMIDQKNAVATK